MKGIFTISLDFEMHWGVFDKRNIKERLRCYENTIQLIPELLKIFEEYKIHVTWATVGSLFAKDESQWRKLKPLEEPDYILNKYSAYKWVNENGFEPSSAFFAPELINTILQYPLQEIGTHTFSHYYCLEKTKHDAFNADLNAAKISASQFDIQVQSLVFPRNQFNKNCLRICLQNGIKVVRTNPDIWFWQSISNEDTNLLRRVFRTGDAYLPLFKRTSYPLNSVKIIKEEPLQIPASRFLRPWTPGYNILNKLSLKRVVNEMTIAAQKNEIYHLWWHPENFGDFPQQNLERLYTIARNYKICAERYEMISWNMKEYADNLLQNEEKQYSTSHKSVA